jgi:hypothetical protein
MSTFFINAAGSNVAPYDTPSKGATSFHQLFNGGVIPFAPLVTFKPGDIVEVVGGSIVNEVVDTPVLAFPTGVQIRAYFNSPIRPFINMNKALTLIISGSISGIDFYKDGGNVGQTFSNYISVNADNVAINSCMFKTVNVASWFDFSMIIAAAKNCKIKNNIFIGSSGPAVNVFGLNAEVVNNTIFNVLLNTIIPVGAINVNNTGGLSAGSVIYNNIIYPNSTNVACAGINIIDVNVAQNYNCIYGIPNRYMGVATAGPNNVHADPLFGFNNSLKYTSPCVNRGAKKSQFTQVPANDFYAQPRPDAVDIGAVEMEGKLPSKGMGLGAIKIDGYLTSAAGVSKERIGTGGYDKTFTITA